MNKLSQPRQIYPEERHAKDKKNCPICLRKRAERLRKKEERLALLQLPEETATKIESKQISIDEGQNGS